MRSTNTGSYCMDEKSHTTRSHNLVQTPCTLSLLVCCTPELRPSTLSATRKVLHGSSSNYRWWCNWLRIYPLAAWKIRTSYFGCFHSSSECINRTWRLTLIYERWRKIDQKNGLDPAVLPRSSKYCNLWITTLHSFLLGHVT